MNSTSATRANSAIVSRPSRRRARPARIANRIPVPAARPGSLRFRGWQFLCPACRRTCDTLCLPLPPVQIFNELDDLLRHEPLICSRLGKTQFACRRCHNVMFFSRVSSDAWNVIVAYLSGGPLRLGGPASEVATKTASARTARC